MTTETEVQEEAKTEEKADKKKAKEPKPQAEKKGRAPSSMPGRRQQFRFAAEAVGASSILAATWLQKPEKEDGDGLALGLFYYRTPDKGEKHKVFQVKRTGGEVKTKLMGEGPDAVETYRQFYSPTLKEVRGKQREQREADLKKEREDKKAAKKSSKKEKEPAQASS